MIKLDGRNWLLHALLVVVRISDLDLFYARLVVHHVGPGVIHVLHPNRLGVLHLLSLRHLVATVVFAY